MRIRYLIIVLFIFCCQNGFSQHEIITKLKDFYAKSDLNCYEQKIQQDLIKFDRWLVDTLPSLNTLPLQVEYRPANIDLQKEKKVFMLAVTLANTEKYRFEDNIYDYLIIDSLRTFIVACVDEKMNVKGITDISEVGAYIDLKDNFYIPKRKRRKQLCLLIKEISKENPDLILFCDAFYSSILYIKNDKIYIVSKGRKKELNEEVRECPDIDMIRRSNKIRYSYREHFEVNSDLLRLRYTGHTPPNEARICPPLPEPIK
ncbi:hypothetical protein [uncultured Bacteroides sp.]|uniref:hypothetical protein n=1 Tax=uncultured Bacteroides sp. TaxID=162156 RepID=UPI002AABF606|nr:hypothetical protein [uncultured Bacteroides sp.]